MPGSLVGERFTDPDPALSSFDTTTAVLGGLLAVGALVSGYARRSFLSLTAAFVLAGIALGRGGFGVLDFGVHSSFIAGLASTALIVILFRDGLEVEAEMLQTAWRLPLRKLVLAMPLTAAIVAGAAKALTDLDWTECFLVGALLAPTDPVLSSSVVTNPRVPRLVRHSLNLESGLNDGLALPAVLAIAAALHPGGAHFVWWRFVLENVTFGVGTGVLVGCLAARLIPRESAFGHEVSDQQKSLYAVGVALLCYGLAVREPSGNGFLAVFSCAIAIGILRADVRAAFEQRAEDAIEVIKLGVFLAFGSLLSFGGLLEDGWAAIGVVAVTLLIARPAAVFAATLGTGTDLFTRAFMGWFGPKGVATMTFGLLVLERGVSAGPRIFNLVALTVVCSIIVHGLTDVAGAERMAAHAERQAGASEIA